MKASIGKVLRRGMQRRCPHCGRGALFQKDVKLYEHCTACGLQYVRNAGDPWAFLLIVDRACFILPIIMGIYFGVLSTGWFGLTLFFAVVLGVVIATTPHRYGVCVALDYLTRRYWGDPADRLPVVPDDSAGPSFG